MEFILLILGSLAVVLVMRWVIRRVAFRFMRFEVPARGQTYIFARERFTDAAGRRVTDPALLAELKEAWRAIELQTANDVARIRSGDL
jgi:hypothetical protein